LYVQPPSTNSKTSFFVCGFHLIHILNSNYFLKDYQKVYLCNGEVQTILCGMYQIPKGYLDEIRLQKAKAVEE
jgi:hypothetical protein